MHFLETSINYYSFNLTFYLMISLSTPFHYTKPPYKLLDALPEPIRAISVNYPGYFSSN